MSQNTLAESDNANLLIELGDPARGELSGLRISAGSSTVRGLSSIGLFFQPSVDDTLGNGILLEGAGGNHIEGNFIGTDPGGTLANQILMLAYSSALRTTSLGARRLRRVT